MSPFCMCGARDAQEPEQLRLPLNDIVAVHCGERDCPRSAVVTPLNSKWVRIECPVCHRYGDRPPISRCDTLTSAP